jgi:NAD(P)-dependent dehydrogenase (short-subunit alcohol dehydrogenase family)
MATWMVTGANRGIGLELTRQLSARGDHVFAGCRAPGEAADLNKLTAGGRVTVIALDVRSDDSVRAAAASVSQPVDVLVNNAGIYGPRSGQEALDMDFGAFAEVLDVNTLGPLRVAQAFLPHVERAKGRIVTITSQMGSLAGTHAGSLAYRASKAAVNKVMLGFADAVRAKGIPVLQMHPGWVRTDMGGKGADIAIPDSAAGIIKVIDGLDMRGTGTFRNYDGGVIAW